MTALVMIGQHLIEICKHFNPTCSDSSLERYRKLVNIVYGNSYEPPVYMTHGAPKPASSINDHGNPLLASQLANSQVSTTNTTIVAPRRRPGWILPADLPPEDRPPDPLRFATSTSQFTPETRNWRTNNEFYAFPPVLYLS
jgi:hypothetical protein